MKLVWQEVFDNQDQVKDDTVVHVWKGGDSGWKNTVNKVSSGSYTGMAITTVLSANSPVHCNHVKSFNVLLRECVHSQAISDKNYNMITL